jgi:hypothetical protein
MYEKTSTSSDETPSIEKFPSKSVFVPFVVFFTTTLTPGYGSPVSESETEPVTVPFCDRSGMLHNTKRIYIK